MIKDHGGASDKRFSNLTKGFDSQVLLRILRKNWYWVPIFVLTSIASAWLYLRYTRPTFRSSTIIQLPQRKNQSDFLEMSSPFGTGSDLAADVEVLRSKFLFEQALKDLELYVSYFAEGDILTEERYSRSSYRVFPSKVPDSTVTEMAFRISADESGGFYLTFMDQGVVRKEELISGKDYEMAGFGFVFEIADRAKFEEEVAENSLYFQFNDIPQLASKLHSDLMVEVMNGDARTVKVMFHSANAELSKDVVDAVVHAYFRFDRERVMEGSDNILSFIEKQLDTVYRHMKASQDSISEFKSASEYSISEEAILDLRKNIEEERAIIQELNDQRIVLRKVSQVINNHPGRLEVYQVQPMVVGTRFEEALGGKLTSLHDLMKEKDLASFHRELKNITMQELEDRIEFEIAMLRSALATLQEKLDEEAILASGRLSAFEAQYYGLPAKEMELSRKTQLHEVNRKYYMLLLEKKTQHAITKAGFQEDFTVLEASKVPESPLSPNRTFVYVGFVLLGGFLAFAILFYKYASFNEITGMDDLRRLVGHSVPVLGSIPHLRRKMDDSELVVAQSSKSRIAEGFRHLRSNIQFAEENSGEPQIIAISSSISGEGKTFVTLNLSGILALSGKKVVVLDMDMRRPKLHLGFDAPNKSGVSNILAGRARWQDCLNDTSLPNLKFITAGPIAPNPSELILKDTFKQLLEELKGEFDYVVFDTPPVGMVSDGVQILNEADCPIYVFRAEYSKRNFVVKVRELIEFEKVNRLFVVLNGDRLGSNTRFFFGGKSGSSNYFQEESRTRKWRILSKKRA